MRSRVYQQSTKATRIAALEGLVCRNQPVGVLAYRAAQPIGWCSIARRETYEALERYRALPRLDTAPVWSVTCFFVDRHERRQGATFGLLKAAVAYALSLGATIVEGYPVEPAARLYTYMGSPHIFLRAGFHDVTPVGNTRRVMRYTLR